MPARDNSYERLTGRGEDGYGNYDTRDHYEWGGYAGGAENQRASMWNQSQGVQQRQGPTIDQRQSDQDFLNAAQARGNEQYLQGYLGNIMNGGATPAQQQLQRQTAQAQAMQRSAGASAHGFGAMAGGPRDAMMRGQQIGLVGGQQLQVQRANDMAMARDQYADITNTMRQEDLRNRGLQQQGSWDQARLTDEQRAQNDAMARFYLDQRYKVGADQLQANEGYEKEQGDFTSGQSNLNWALQQQKDANDARGTAAAMKMGGDALAVGTSMGGSDDDDERYR